MSLKNRFTKLSIIGLVLIFPISSFIISIIPYVIISMLIGEDALEDESGQTPLGAVVLLSPAISGLVLIAYDFFFYSKSSSRISAHTAGAVLGALGVALAVLAIASTLQTVEDGANIGAGIVFLLSIASLTTAGILLRKR